MAAPNIVILKHGVLPSFNEGHFGHPTGVTASDAKIFLADPAPHHEKIIVLNLEGELVHEFPTVVQDGQKMRPEDVAMDGKGNLWVVGSTSDANFAVQYTREGSYLTQIDLPKSALPKGIAVDTTSNHVLVTQSMIGPQVPPYSPNFIGVYREDGTKVTVLRQREGTRLKQQYLAVDGRSGNILVSDETENCISVYSKENGQFLFQFGGEGQLDRPHGICTDRAGNIIVADYGNSRVVVFDNNSKFCKNLVSNIQPQAVALTSQGKLVVTSAHENKVTIFG